MKESLKENFIAIAILILFGLFYLYPILFQGLYPTGTDVVGSAGASQIAIDLSQKTGEKFMWNPALFSGLPTYFAWGAVSWNLDDFVRVTAGKLIPYNAIFFFIGAVGIFVLLKELKINVWVALFASLSFLLLVHNSVLFQEGHFKKFRTLMWLPLVFWGFLRLMNKASLLNMSIFALFLSLMFRGAHYQIIFYTAILLIFVGIYKLIEQIRAKQPLLKFVVFSFLALSLAIASVAQPLFLTKEYAPYSMRGGKSGGFETSEKKEEKPENSKDKPGGLSYDYATSWSFPPSEYMTFLVPRFYGGGAVVYYDGSNPKYRQFKNRAIPAGYWGALPFTASTEYVGIIVVFLALIAVILYWKNLFIRTIFATLIFCIFLSFGSHFSILYDLFYYYVPYFNKFRAPMMILTMINFLIIILAAYGLHAVLSSEFELKQKTKPVIYSFAFFLAVLLLAKLFSSSLDFASARELQQYTQQNQQQTLSIIQDIRAELFHSDLNRSILFLVIAFGLIFLYLNEKLKKYFIHLIILLAVFDLYQINQRYLIQKVGNRYTHLNRLNKVKEQEFRKTKTDDFLLSKKDKNLDLAKHRIYPVYSDFWNTNKYSFYHQSIGGYDPAKMRIYQDLLDYGADRVFISRNIVNMLNAKYLMTEFPIEGQIYDSLKLVYQDGKTKVFENLESSGRAWFVGDAKVLKTRDERFTYLKSQGFDVNKSAIIEESLSSSISKPANHSVTVNKLSLHQLEYNVKNDSTSLLVFSEVYYPLGWKAYIDGEESKIYKTNHVLRSIIVPAGEHNIKMVFSPDNLVNSIRMSTISTWLIFIVIALSLIVLYSDKLNLSIPEKIKSIVV